MPSLFRDAGVVDGDLVVASEDPTLTFMVDSRGVRPYVHRKYHDEGVVKTNHNISHAQPSDRAGGRCDVTNSIGG